MAQLVHLQCKNIDEKNIVDKFISSYSLFGYQINPKAKESMIEFYYLMVTNKDEIYMIKNFYFINSNIKEKEMKYFNSPIHISQNLNLDIARGNNDLNRRINDTISRFKDNTFHVDFKANNVSLGKETIKFYGFKENNIESVINFEIPFKIYFRLASITNSILMKLPIYTTIEEDTRWDIYNLYNNCKLNYLGASPTNDGNIISYYSLDIGNKLIGFAQLNKNIRAGLIGKTMNNEQFIRLFGKDGFFLSDPTKTLILDWDTKDGIKQRVAVAKPSKNNKSMNIYVIDQDIEKSSILNPYQDIFITNGGK